MKVNNILLLASLSVATAQDLKAKLTPRNAVSLDTLFVRAVPAIRAMAKRDDDEAVATPLRVPKRGLLEARQSACLPTEVTCTIEKGCCKANTVCGTYGGVPGCCPVGKTCNTVSGCAAGQTSCGKICCRAGISCITDSTGAPVCDSGSDAPSGSTTVVGVTTTAVSSGTGTRTGSVSPTASVATCPAGYSPCEGEDLCCPAGAKCLPNKKCDVECKATYPLCGLGCCLPGTVCDEVTDTCNPVSSGAAGSSSTTRRASTTSFTRPTSSSLFGGDDEEASSTTLGGAAESSSVGISGGSSGGSGSSGSSSGGSGSGGSSPSSGTKVVVGMGVAMSVGIVGLFLL